MRNKDYIKEINKEIDSHKNYEQISSKLQFKDQERVFNMKNRKLKIVENAFNEFWHFFERNFQLL